MGGKYALRILFGFILAPMILFLFPITYIGFCYCAIGRLLCDDDVPMSLLKVFLMVCSYPIAVMVWQVLYCLVSECPFDEC